jgi:hypothetical protein
VEKMKPDEKQKLMERNGWQLYRKWSGLNRLVMVRKGLTRDPEYVTILRNGKIEHGYHGPAEGGTI